MIACGEDVGEQREIGFEFVAGRERQAVEVGMGHLQVLCLTAAPGAHRHIAIRAAREAGVDGDAESGESSLAVLAEATRHIEGHHDSITCIQGLHGIADFLDDAHVFVAKNDAGFRGCSALVHVQVRAADAGRSYLYDYVVGVQYLRVWNILYGHAEGSLIHDGFHGKSSFDL